MARPEYKMRLKAWRVHGFLKAKKPLTPEQRVKLEKLTSMELAAAARNSDHTLIGREAAQTLLRQRGGRLIEADIIVPGFVKATDTSDLKKVFFGASRTIRLWAGWMILVSALLAFVAIGYSVEHEDAALRQAKEAGIITAEEFYSADRDLTDEEFEAARALDSMRIDAFQSQNSLRDYLLIKAKSTPAGQKMMLGERLGYIAVTVLAITTLIWFFAVVFRGQPARILLLRKFNDKKVSKSLSHVISSHITPFGHTTTLSDKFFKKSAWSWLWDLIPRHWALIPITPVWMIIRLFFRQFNRAKWGPVWVGSARNYRCLAKRLRDRIPLNFIVSCSSRKEAFLVRTHDNWWQEVIKMIMNSSDVIVVDLSNVTAGTEWELERLDATQMWQRSVFIAHEDTREKAFASIQAYQWREEVQLFTYDRVGDLGKDAKAQFREAMLTRIGQTAKTYANA